MEKTEILVKVQDIFRDVLDNEEIVLNNDTSADDIEEWDSLSHIQLIVAMRSILKLNSPQRKYSLGTIWER